MPDGGPSGFAAFIEAVARAQLHVVLITMLGCTVIRLASLYGMNRWGDAADRFLQIIADLADAVIYAGILVYFVVRPFLIQTFWIPSESMVDTLRKQDYLVVNKAIYRMRDPVPGEIVVFRAPQEAMNPGQDASMTDFIKRCIGAPGQLIEVKRDEFGDYRVYRDGKKVEEPYLGSPMREEFKLVNPLAADLSPIEMDTLRQIGLRPDSPQYLPIRRTLRQGGMDGPYENLYIIGETPLSGHVAELGDKLWALPAEELPKDCYLMMGDNRSYSKDGRFWGIVQRWRIIGRAEFVFFPLNRISRAGALPKQAAQE